MGLCNMNIFKRGLSVFAVSLAAGCGGADGEGAGANANGANGNGLDGDSCSGGDFQMAWSGDATGSITGDCVVSVRSSGTDDGVVPPTVTITAAEEGGDFNRGLSLRIHRETEAPIQAVFSPSEDVGCSESDVFSTGAFDGTVEFTRRDTDGYAVSFDINMSCSDDSVDPPLDSTIQLVGTLSGSSDTL